MASSIRKNLAALVISLAFPVISLPAPASAVVAPPVVDIKKVKVVTDGLKTPVGIALDADGSIYVTDPVRRGVTKFNKYGKDLMFFSTAGTPQRVAASGNGNGSVLVSQGTFVAEYNNNGAEKFRLSKDGQPFQFRLAGGIAVHPGNGDVYVADAGDRNIRIFDKTGIYKSTFGPDYVEGTFTFNMGMPMDVTVTDEGAGSTPRYRVVVVDTVPMGRPPVLFFSESGVFQYAACSDGVSGTLSAQCLFALPLGIAVEYANGQGSAIKRLYSADTHQGWVVAFDQNIVPNKTYRGNFSGLVGGYGTKPGELVTPSGVVFDQENKRLIVTNGYGNLTFYPVDNGSNPVSSDKIFPVFTINPLSANNVSDPTLTLSGTREGADVKVLMRVASSGVQVGETTYPTSTTWSCTLSNLAEGRNDIVAEGSDAAGNVQAKSLVVYYTKSATAGFTITPWPLLTGSASYTFTGTKPNGVNVTTVPNTCTNNATTWSCPVSLVEGINNVPFTIGGSTTTATITSDRTKPVLQVYALASGDSTSNQVQNFAGVVDDLNFDKLTLTVNGGAAQSVAVTVGANGKGSFNVPVVLNAAGANTISLVASDQVNNSTTETRTLNLDVSAPKVVVASPSDGKVVRSSTGVLSLNGSVDRTGTTCSIGATPLTMAGMGWSGSVTLVPGYNNIIVSCVNGGQQSKVKRTVLYDVNSLELAVNAPGQDQAVNASSVTIQGDVDPATEILISTLNGETSTIPVTNGTFSFTANLDNEGAYSYRLTAVDGAGNDASSVTRTLVADKTPPVLGITYGAVATGSSISGTVEPGAMVVVKDFNNNTVGSVSMGAGSFAAALGQNYDLFTLIVSATDQAGNVTTKSAAKPDADCNASGAVATDDASFCLDIIAGITVPTTLQNAHCDVGPLKAGQVSPNGQVDITDCILALRKANGLPPTWW